MVCVCGGRRGHVPQMSCNTSVNQSHSSCGEYLLANIKYLSWNCHWLVCSSSNCKYSTQLSNCIWRSFARQKIDDFTQTKKLSSLAQDAESCLLLCCWPLIRTTTTAAMWVRKKWDDPAAPECTDRRTDGRLSISISINLHKVDNHTPRGDGYKRRAMAAAPATPRWSFHRQKGPRWRPDIGNNDRVVTCGWSQHLKLLITCC